MIRESVDNKFM